MTFQIFNESDDFNPRSGEVENVISVIVHRAT